MKGGGGRFLQIEVVVPEGTEGAASLRLTTPSGNAILVPLPEGASEGAHIAFALQPNQAAILPREDVLALGDGRFRIGAAEE